MAIYRPDNPDERKISQLDIDTVRKIYGTNGFIIKTVDSDDGSMPLWIRNNAKWWNENQISDQDFIKGIEFLIQKKILVVQKTIEPNQNNQQIPFWVKNNAGWWAHGVISDEEFLNGITWLVNNNIIKIPIVK